MANWKEPIKNDVNETEYTITTVNKIQNKQVLQVVENGRFFLVNEMLHVLLYADSHNFIIFHQCLASLALMLTQPTNQPTNLSINQPINSSIHQFINLSVTWTGNLVTRLAKQRGKEWQILQIFILSYCKQYQTEGLVY